MSVFCRLSLVGGWIWIREASTSLCDPQIELLHKSVIVYLKYSEPSQAGVHLDIFAKLFFLLGFYFYLFFSSYLFFLSLALTNFVFFYRFQCRIFMQLQIFSSVFVYFFVTEDRWDVVIKKKKKNALKTKLGSKCFGGNLYLFILFSLFYLLCSQDSCSSNIKHSQWVDLNIFWFSLMQSVCL